MSGGSKAQVDGLATLARLKRVDFDSTHLQRGPGRMTAPVTTLTAGKDEFELRLVSVGVVVSSPGLPDQFIPMHAVRRGVLG